MKALCAALFALAACLSRAAEDPFAYLEDAADPRTGDFLREESAKARAVLDAIPGRAELAARIRALSASATVVTHVKTAGTRVFYLKAAPGAASPALFAREGLAGPERLLAEPAPGSVIDGFSPAPDGRHVAFGLAPAAGEDAVLRVVAADGARALAVAIERVRSAGEVAWHPDARSFFYARAAEARRHAPARVYRHLLGRDPARDEIVFAPGVGGARDVPEGAQATLRIPAETRHAYAVVREGARREIALHVSPLADLDAGRPRWVKVAGVEDEVLAVEAWRDDVYLIAKRGAPRHRVVRIKAGAAGLAGAKQVVPQGEAVIQDLALARDALYLRTMVAGVDRLERVALGLLGAKAPEYVRTPFDTGISQLLADPRQPGALLRLEGWIEPPAIVQVEAASGNLRRTPIQPATPPDFSEMDEVRLYAPAHDGARIPVTLVYRKTTRLDGQNPTLLTAFGSFGAAVAPAFDPARLAWLERGGIFAVAHVRGGGEYGDDWHRAGRGAAKITTVLDFIAVADFIVRYGFTNPRRLAIEGAGAGAVPVGGALARRPELFAAVVAREPILDLVRLGATAPLALPEFGAAGEALLAVSSYHQLRPGADYPAVLLSAAAPSDFAHPAKMAARLAASTRSGKPVLLRLAETADPRAARDAEMADVYAFLFWQMDDPRFQLPPAPPLVGPPAPEPAAPAAPQ